MTTPTQKLKDHSTSLRDELLSKSEWQKLPRSERAQFGHLECDVWKVGHDGARYSVLDTKTGRYAAGGKCLDLEWAKQVSSGFAQSLLQLGESE